jgi:hypothetical protein
MREHPSTRQTSLNANRAYQIQIQNIAQAQRTALPAMSISSVKLDASQLKNPNKSLSAPVDALAHEKHAATAR